MIVRFKGDVSGSIVGRIMGPDANGNLSEAVRAEYAPLANLTIVEFEPIGNNDQRLAMPDEFGELRLVSDG